MAKHWTKEQALAIDLREKSLLLSAAAGSGKTAVLVERIITMISQEENPVNIDELLIVTFTNAAAAEMKERISMAINEQLGLNPDSAHLYRQSLLLQKTQITTLHAFCLDLVRSNFFKLGIDPNLKIVDEMEGQMLKQEVLDELFEGYYSLEEGGEAFTALIDSYGGREDEAVAWLILSLHQMAMSTPDWGAWLDGLSDQLTATPWISLFLPVVQGEIREIKQSLAQALAISQGDEGLQGYLAVLQSDDEAFDFLAKAGAEGWDSLYHGLETTTDPFGRMPRVKKDSYDEANKEAVEVLRKNAKARYKKIKETSCTRSEEAILGDITCLAPHVGLLATLTRAFHEGYQEKKKTKNLMDFDDMEHFCLQLLYEQDDQGRRSLSELSNILQGKYQEILVDEYQDINDLQEQILQAVSRSNNLFMVGDIKQSIYGFRMANPQLFLAKYRAYPSAEDSEAQPTRRIDLNKNFRCRRNIVNNVNYIFRHLMTGNKNDLFYDEQASLIFGAYYPDEPGIKTLDDTLSFILIDQELDQGDEEEATVENELKDIEVEGQVIGEKIKELMADQVQVFDKDLGAYRQIDFRDLVILLRSPKSSAKILLDQLKDQGIPAYMDSGDGYFTAWEVQIILAFLHILDNPCQDIPLAATLRAPFFAFSEEELLAIRLTQAKEGLYQCLTVFDQASNQGLGAKIGQFMASLTHWRTVARQKDLSSLLWQLYKETGFYDYVGALPGGGQRQANLRALHEKTRQYEQTSFKGLFMFLRFIEQMQANHKDLEPAKLLGDNENVVRIMSIHKSKGLEFPVVFLANVGKKFNMMDINRDSVLDKDLGLGLPMVDTRLNYKYPTICQSVIKEKLKSAAIIEEKRVLYVALTRAREKLYLIGSCSNYGEKVAQYQRKRVDNAQSYLDWLIPLFQKTDDRDFRDEHSEATWRFEVVKGSLKIKVPLEESASTFLTAIKALEPLETEGLYREAIDHILNWQYSELALSKIKSKATVTEIKERFGGQASPDQGEKQRYGFTRRPLSVQEKKGLSPTEKGTLIHLMMSQLDLQTTITTAYLQELAQRLEAQAYIAAGQSQAISLAPILNFFQSPLGQRLQQVAPSQIYRELPFTYTVPSSLYDPNLPLGSKPVLVQGMIDCMWLEEGGWVLLDYKSDYIQEADLPAFIQAYQGQVQLYAQAVADIWKIPVKERYLYLFHLNQLVAI